MSRNFVETNIVPLNITGFHVRSVSFTQRNISQQNRSGVASGRSDLCNVKLFSSKFPSYF